MATQPRSFTLYRPAGGLPVRDAANQKARVDPGIAQAGGGRLADFVSVHAIDDHFGTRKLARPFVHTLGIAPDRALYRLRRGVVGSFAPHVDPFDAALALHLVRAGREEAGRCLDRPGI